MRAIPLIVFCVLCAVFGSVDTLIGLFGGMGATALLFSPPPEER